ncbi:MAG: MFS transporter [Candidatus Bathyarchaeia archaeon]
MTASILNFKKTFHNKKILVVTGLFFNTFSWYYLCRLVVVRLGQRFIECFFRYSLLIMAYLISIIISAIAGAAFLKGKQRLLLLKVWIIFGVLVSLLTIPIQTNFSYLEIFVISVLLGVSLGAAMPFCLDLIRLVTIENRGKIGGIVLLAIFSSVFILYESVFSLDLMFVGFLLAIWRACSLPLLSLIPEGTILGDDSIKKPQKFALILTNKTFLLYFAAWFMFALIDNFQGVVMKTIASDFPFFTRLVEPFVAGFSAIIIGILIDHIGRRPVLICSFIFLGIADAILGLFPHYWVSWLLYSVINGIAIGSASVLFIMVIWGEMSTNNSVKLYAIGEIPFFVADVLAVPLTPFLLQVPYSSSFSLASFFLFIAVVPLVFAPETLPEKTLKERELRSYIEKAKRVREKFTKG